MRTGDIKAAMRARYCAPEWALMFEVGDGTGVNQRRWADAVAMNLWPSRGMEVNGFEIKVSRSDWQRELKNPAKAESVQQYCDRWWIVTAPGIVKDGELPNDSETTAADAVRREDGSWLIDGAMTLERFGQLMNIDRFETDRGDDFHTMGGFAMHYLGRIPAVAERFERGGFTFEIVDMDRNRVDKMLVTPPPEEPEL